MLSLASTISRQYGCDSSTVSGSRRWANFIISTPLMIDICSLALSRSGAQWTKLGVSLVVLWVIRWRSTVINESTICRIVDRMSVFIS